MPHLWNLAQIHREMQMWSFCNVTKDWKGEANSGLDGAASTKSGSNHLYIRRCCMKFILFTLTVCIHLLITHTHSLPSFYLSEKSRSFILFLHVSDLKQPPEGPKLNEDYGDTVPSRPFNNGLQVTNEVPTASTLVKQKISDGVELEGEGRLIVYVVPSRLYKRKGYTVFGPSNRILPSCLWNYTVLPSGSVVGNKFSSPLVNSHALNFSGNLVFVLLLKLLCTLLSPQSFILFSLISKSLGPPNSSFFSSLFPLIFISFIVMENGLKWRS